MENEDLRLVKVQVATCPYCNGAILIAVKHSMSKETIKEFNNLIKDGFDIHTTNVIVARTLKWCWENDCVRNKNK